MLKFCEMRLRLLPSPVIRKSFKQFCTNELELGVHIPKRIERGPTDILKALSGTLKHDPTAQHYKFPDDPYFEANSTFTKRILALSLESGRKSAKWIVENNPEYFKEIISDPFIKSYAPPNKYNEDSKDVGEQTLVQVIHERNLSDAVTIYNLLQEKNCELSDETKQMLLELVCFYNNSKKINDDELETKWYTVQSRESVGTWKNQGFAQELFATMNQDCPLALSALIQGMLKYGEIKKAVKLYKDALNKNITLSVGVYNGMLENVSTIVGSKKWEHIIELLEEMNEKEIKPDISTLYAILKSLHQNKDIKDKYKKALAIVAEFEKLDIKPTLGSYGLLISIIVKTKQLKYSDVFCFISNILQSLKGKNLEIQHPQDMQFFTHVMETIERYTKNSQLAHKLHSILLEKCNKNFIGNNLDFYNYYKSYLYVVLKYEAIDSFLHLYESVVPNVFSPASSFFRDVVIELKLANAYKALPIIWVDILQLSERAKSDMCVHVLTMIKSYEEYTEDISRVFSEAADEIYEHIMKGQFTEDFQLTDDLASNLIITYFKIGNKHKGLDVFNISKSDDYFSYSPLALTLLFNHYLENGTVDEVSNCLNQAVFTKHPNVSEFVKKAQNKFSDLDMKWSSVLPAKSSDISSKK